MAFFLVGFALGIYVTRKFQADVDAVISSFRKLIGRGEDK